HQNVFAPRAAVRNRNDILGFFGSHDTQVPVVAHCAANGLLRKLVEFLDGFAVNVHLAGFSKNLDEPRFHSQPVARFIEKINPILRGWVNYFAVGHSSRCFSYIRDWVEKKIRSHLARACQRRGFGWKRWSREWLHGTLRLFGRYQVAHSSASSIVASAQ